jgi:hypothetical protein
MEIWDDTKIEQIKKSFSDLIDMGPEQWTQNYTLSHNDKITQIDLMIEYFESPEVEEYEKCQYLFDLKNNMDIHRYML